MGGKGYKWFLSEKEEDLETFCIIVVNTAQSSEQTGKEQQETTQLQYRTSFLGYQNEVPYPSKFVPSSNLK